MEQKIGRKYMCKMLEISIPTKKVRDIQERHQEKGMSGAAARTGIYSKEVTEKDS